MKILVTGSAGFIGSELCIKLLERGDAVIGIDNHNDYYDPSLKEARLARYLGHPNYIHLRFDISDRKALEKVFEDYQPNRVVNLAAQAGVRYSIENPDAYIQSNIVGFFNVLQCCAQNKIEHLVYASSSSVYGANTSTPFSEHDSAEHPLSLYAASKKSNEMMAHAYSHLYGLPTTGLRFFTVYGPWGRPDMAPFKFANAIISDEKLMVYNFGKHARDFTFIDDVIEGILQVIYSPSKPNKNWSSQSPDPSSSPAPYRIFNIGNSNPTDLLDFINALGKALGKKAEMEFLPMQMGDVMNTYANVDEMSKRFGYKPSTDINDGVKSFAEWYQEYFSNKA